MPSKIVGELREIVRRDYGTAITNEDAEELGVSLLRLTRLAVAAQARANEIRQKRQERLDDLRVDNPRLREGN